MTDIVGNPLPFSLANRVALVTGASRGLGLEIALGMARAGAHVLVNSRSAERTGEVAARIRQEGYWAEPLPFDVADDAAARAAFAEIGRRFGKLDIFVENVAERFRAPIGQISTEEFHRLLAINLTPGFSLTKMAAGLMIPQGYGRIIMITSIAGMLGGRGDAAYMGAKSGLTGLMKAFACEYGEAGITCNAIAPGPFATESNEGITAERLERVRLRVPMKRRGSQAEIAGPAVFLASEAASYVNGHVLVVDGGYSMTL